MRVAQSDVEDLPPDQERQAKKRESTTADITYEVIRRQGEHELERATGALAWSGLAAGMSMGFSFIAMAGLRESLPDTPWAGLIERLGYSVGFLIVILGAQQLFTENTLKAVVPVLAKPSRHGFVDVARVWSVVLGANMIGSLLFTFLLTHTRLFDDSYQRVLLEIANEALGDDILATFVRSIVAGWLIALMVWMLPGADQSRFLVIVVMSWLVAVSGFSHIVAGASETLYLVIGAHTGIGTWFTAFFLPTLVGNVLGGTLLVAALNHAQVAPDRQRRIIEPE
jgi:formate-nitrite transporter family protein